MTVNRIIGTLLCVLVLPAVGTTAPDDSDQTAPNTDQHDEIAAAATTSLRTLFHDLWGDFTHLPSRNSAVIASMGGVAALAVHPLDSEINQRLADDEGFFKGGRSLATP